MILRFSIFFVFFIKKSSALKCTLKKRKQIFALLLQNSTINDWSIVIEYEVQIVWTEQKFKFELHIRILKFVYWSHVIVHFEEKDSPPSHVAPIWKHTRVLNAGSKTGFVSRHILAVFDHFYLITAYISFRNRALQNFKYNKPLEDIS